MAAAEYIPGVCNIGRTEVRRRQLIGWVGLAITVGAWIACSVLQVLPTWRLTLFVPASISATGFLQAAWRFCATFGMLGLTRFDSDGRTQSVKQAEFRRQDRRTALKIIALSLLVGAIVAAAAYYLPH